MSKRKSHEEFEVELSKINPNVELLNNYINCKTKVKCKCKIDGYIWESFPNNLLHGHGCSVCCKNKRKDNEEFIMNILTINPNINILENYNGANKPIKCRCKIHNKNFKSTPRNLLKGSGCNECKNSKISKKLSLSEKGFINKLNEIDSNLVLLGEYKSMLKKSNIQV